MKQGNGLQSFDKTMYWSWQTPSSSNTIEDSTHRHDHMVNTEIRLIDSLWLKMEKLYTVSQKKDWKLCVAQIMNS